MLRWRSLELLFTPSLEDLVVEEDWEAAAEVKAENINCLFIYFWLKRLKDLLSVGFPVILEYLPKSF